MQKLIALVLVLVCVLGLAGCSFNRIAKEPTAPHIETTLPTTHAETSSASTTITSTENSTKPYETQSPTTEPTQSETIPSPVIVQPEPSDDDFVMVITYIPDIFVDLRYSTEFNFTNQKIYDFTDVWLRYGTVKKLVLVQEELKQSGLYLKIWDGFRPPSAQFKLWHVAPTLPMFPIPIMGSVRTAVEILLMLLLCMRMAQNWLCQRDLMTFPNLLTGTMVIAAKKLQRMQYSLKK